MTHNEEFFIRESVRHARSLSCQDAATFLRGMMMACGEIEFPEPLRETVGRMVALDRELDFFTSCDLQLNPTPPPDL